MSLLVQIKDRVRAKDLITQALTKILDGWMDEKPCAFVRLAFNHAMFISNAAGETEIMGVESWEAFLLREVTNVHHFIKKH